jgi:hypothetical protein
MTIFDEEYRVIAVERHRLTIRGVCTGNVLVINAETALSEEEYAPGKLIVLSHPSTAFQG